MRCGPDLYDYKTMARSLSRYDIGTNCTGTCRVSKKDMYSELVPHRRARVS